MVFVEFVDQYGDPLAIRLDRILGLEVRSQAVDLLIVEPNSQSCYTLKGTFAENLSILRHAANPPAQLDYRTLERPR